MRKLTAAVFPQETRICTPLRSASRLGWPGCLSDMESFTQSLEARLVKSLAKRRVCVDRACDVLQPGAHFERKAESGRKFRNARAHGVDAKHEVVVGAGGDAHKAVLSPQGHGAAIGLEREQAGADLEAGHLGFVRGEPDGDDLRIREADGRDRDFVEGPSLAGAPLCGPP